MTTDDRGFRVAMLIVLILISFVTALSCVWQGRTEGAWTLLGVACLLGYMAITELS